MIKQNTLLIMLVILFFASCKKEEIPVPSYVQVDEIKFATHPNQGSSRHNFKDIWLFINGDYVGAYEVPFKVPVIADGITQIEAFAGIRNNGTLTQPSRYGMCDSYKTQVDLKRDQVTKITPSYTLSADVTTPLIEDFESLHFFNDDKDQDPSTKIVNSGQAEAYEGNNAGLIELTATNSSCEAWYDFARKIPVSPNPIYLEFHYKSDIPFSIGFAGFKSGIYDQKFLNGKVFPKSEWTKVYFDFSELLNTSGDDAFKVAIGAVFQTDIALTKQRILIDNVKVLYR